MKCPICKKEFDVWAAKTRSSARKKYVICPHCGEHIQFK